MLADKVILLDDDPASASLARDCYYAGEARCFYVGRIAADPARAAALGLAEDPPAIGRPVGPVYHLDVRSMYLSILAGDLLPCRRLARLESPTLEQVRAALQLAGGAAIVRIQSPTLPYPVRSEGRLLYAVGDYWTALCGPELEAALARGHVADCRRLVTYSLGRPARDWALHWWRQRQLAEAEGDKQRSAFAKLIGNSLVGKFGQRSMSWTDQPATIPPAGMRWGRWSTVDAQTGAVVQWRCLAGLAQCQEARGDKRDSWPILAAWVAAIGRERMRSIRQRCPDRSVYYQDTDGILCSPDAFDALLDAGQIGGDELGDLRLVTCYETAEIVGIKSYRTDATEHRAGLGPDHQWLGAHSFSQLITQRAEDVTRQRPAGAVVQTSCVLTYKSEWLADRIQPDGWTLPHLRHDGRDAPWQ